MFLYPILKRHPCKNGTLSLSADGFRADGCRMMWHLPRFIRQRKASALMRVTNPGKSACEEPRPEMILSPFLLVRMVSWRIACHRGSRQAECQFPAVHSVRGKASDRNSESWWVPSIKSCLSLKTQVKVTKHKINYLKMNYQWPVVPSMLGSHYLVPKHVHHPRNHVPWWSRYTPFSFPLSPSNHYSLSLPFASGFLYFV